jgi:hypothetical protein
MDVRKYTVSVNARLMMLYAIARLEALQAAGKGHEPS